MWQGQLALSSLASYYRFQALLLRASTRGDSKGGEHRGCGLLDTFVCCLHATGRARTQTWQNGEK